jgi:hypothetical protein
VLRGNSTTTRSAATANWPATRGERWWDADS